MDCKSRETTANAEAEDEWVIMCAKLYALFRFLFSFFFVGSLSHHGSDEKWSEHRFMHYIYKEKGLRGDFANYKDTSLIPIGSKLLVSVIFLKYNTRDCDTSAAWRSLSRNGVPKMSSIKKLCHYPSSPARGYDQPLQPFVVSGWVQQSSRTLTILFNATVANFRQNTLSGLADGGVELLPENSF